MGFEDRFPRWLTAVVGITQLVLTAGVIGLELASVYIDIVHGTIWIGFWAGLVFIPTSLLVLLFTCCCRGRICGLYGLILNIISAALAGTMIYFDQYFTNNVCQCYLSDVLCCAVRGIPGMSSNYSNLYNTCQTLVNAGTASSTVRCYNGSPNDKLAYIKAQLACACAMLVACGVYAILYLFACFGVCWGH